MNNQLWQKVLQPYRDNPRDVATTPTRGEPKWFYVSVYANDIYIDSGRSHVNKCKVSTSRVLDKMNIDRVFELYCLRKRGLIQRTEVTTVTQNSSYWFGIFEDLGL